MYIQYNVNWCELSMGFFFIHRDWKILIVFLISYNIDRFWRIWNTNQLWIVGISYCTKENWELSKDLINLDQILTVWKRAIFELYTFEDHFNNVYIYVDIIYNYELLEINLKCFFISIKLYITLWLVSNKNN